MLSGLAVITGCTGGHEENIDCTCCVTEPEGYVDPRAQLCKRDDVPLFITFESHIMKYATNKVNRVQQTLLLAMPQPDKTGASRE